MVKTGSTLLNFYLKQQNLYTQLNIIKKLKKNQTKKEPKHTFTMTTEQKTLGQIV